MPELVYDSNLPTKYWNSDILKIIVSLKMITISGLVFNYLVLQ